MRTSLEYLLELFKLSAQQLHVDYIHTTASRLQDYARETKPPFIGLLNVTKTDELTPTNDFIKTYTCVFFCVVDSEADPTPEQKVICENNADSLVERFKYFVNKNKNIFDMSSTDEGLFRNDSYLGLGKGFTLTLSLRGLDEFCDDFCNNSTVTLDCE